MRIADVPDKHAGRLIGALLLLHLGCGLILPYVLLNPVLAPPGFLAQAAAQSASLRTAVTLFIVAAALVVAVAVAAWPLFRAHGERLATAFLAVAIANLALQLVESGAVLTMLSLSQQVSAAGADAGPLQAVGAALGSARRWAHYTQLLTVVSWLFLLYLNLWRAALVPRLLAAAGMVTTLLQIAGVPARVMLGYPPIMELAMPLAPVHLTLAIWLILKGLRVAPQAPEEA